jgi:hypothetical protein
MLATINFRIEDAMNTVKVRVTSVSGQITEVQIAPDVVDAARALLHSPERLL